MNTIPEPTPADDPVLREMVTPHFEIGCKRILISNTFYPALASANGCINDASRAWFAMGRDRDRYAALLRAMVEREAA